MGGQPAKSQDSTTGPFEAPSHSPSPRVTSLADFSPPYSCVADLWTCGLAHTSTSSFVFCSVFETWSCCVGSQGWFCVMVVACILYIHAWCPSTLGGHGVFHVGL